eukprot:300159-Amorphochlora_amoeboformis.AAC.1
MTVYVRRRRPTCREVADRQQGHRRHQHRHPKPQWAGAHDDFFGCRSLRVTITCDTTHAPFHGRFQILRRVRALQINVCWGLEVIDARIP